MKKRKREKKVMREYAEADLPVQNLYTENKMDYHTNRSVFEKEVEEQVRQQVF